MTSAFARMLNTNSTVPADRRGTSSCGGTICLCKGLSLRLTQTKAFVVRTAGRMLLYLLSASKMPQRHLLSPRGKVRRSSRSLCCLGGNVGCGGACCPPGCCQRCRVFDPRSPGPYYEYVCRAPDNPEYADCCVNLRERSAH